MPSHPVGHVFLTLQWNSLGRASFEVHESQRDVRLGETGIPNVTVWQVQMFQQIQDDGKFQDSVLFSDESTFHVSGRVNTHNCRIWGSENPRVSLEMFVIAQR